MKRFHVHVVVPKLDESVRFYSSMFGAEPSVLKDDYAKWMLEDPRMNFAISARGGEVGVNHLGFQVDSDEELAALREQVVAGSVAVQDQPGAQCCYASLDNVKQDGRFTDNHLGRSTGLIVGGYSTMFVAPCF